MEPPTIRDHLLRILALPSLPSIRSEVTMLLSQHMKGYTLEESQWLFSAILIYTDPVGAPEWVYARARDYVRAMVHLEGMEGAAAAYLQSVNQHP